MVVVQRHFPTEATAISPGKGSAGPTALILDLAAKLLVDQRGEDAPIRATERADEMLEAGDIEGAAIWRAIMDAIEELQRGPERGKMVNRGLHDNPAGRRRGRRQEAH